MLEFIRHEQSSFVLGQRLLAAMPKLCQLCWESSACEGKASHSNMNGHAAVMAPPQCNPVCTVLLTAKSYPCWCTY